MSIEVKDAPDTAQQLRETVHDMRRPVAAMLALAAAAPTEADLPAAVSWPGEVTLTSTAGPVWCMLHPLLRRFVSNVLVNSTRAAGPAGKVAVDIRRRKGAVVLTVEDNAPGFGRIPSGAGLGLSAVARNVVKHGGRMECGGVHASCRLYRQSIGRDRVWRDGLSSRFKCGVPGPEGCVAIVRQVFPWPVYRDKITQSQRDTARRPCWEEEGATDGDLPNLIDAPFGSDGEEWGESGARGAGMREHP